MPEDRHTGQKKIQAWIPLSMWENLEALGYASPTHAVTKAFELLLDNPGGDIRESHRVNVGYSEIPALNARIEEKEQHIETLKTELKAQVDLLAEQLHTKDGQIEKLNENMQRQAVHIQSLIQENSRLNIKLLPENTNSKKPWWKFW